MNDFQEISHGLYTPSMKGFHLLIASGAISRHELQLAKRSAAEWYSRWGIPMVLEMAAFEGGVEGSYQFKAIKNGRGGYRGGYFLIKIDPVPSQDGVLWHELVHAKQTARLLKVGGGFTNTFFIALLFNALPLILNKLLKNKIYYWLPCEIEAYWKQETQHNGKGIISFLKGYIPKMFGK